MRFCPYFIRGLIILSLFWNQMLRLYFDIFDKDFNDKLETICVHFKSRRNLDTFFTVSTNSEQTQRGHGAARPHEIGAALDP